MKRFLVLAVVLVSTLTQAKVIVGDAAVFATGAWDESHEGVSLFCAYVTNPVDVTKGSSSAGCFLTEVQAFAKDSTGVSINVLDVQKWDKHSLTATTSVYVDKNGNDTNASNPDGTKFTFRIVVDFDAHSLTKYVEAPTKTLGYHLKGD